MVKLAFACSFTGYSDKFLVQICSFSDSQALNREPRCYGHLSFFFEEGDSLGSGPEGPDRAGTRDIIFCQGEAPLATESSRFVFMVQY